MHTETEQRLRTLKERRTEAPTRAAMTLAQRGEVPVSQMVRALRHNLGESLTATQVLMMLQTPAFAQRMQRLGLPEVQLAATQFRSAAGQRTPVLERTVFSAHTETDWTELYAELLPQSVLLSLIAQS